MFLALLRKEIVLHILALRFNIAMLLIFLLVFSAFYVAVHDFQNGRAEASMVKREARESLVEIAKIENQRERFNKLHYDVGIMDAVPLPDLSIITLGLGRIWPIGFRITRYSATGLERSVAGNPLFELFKPPDFVYVVNMILSLLAILLVFDAVCGEKENGTLRLMLSNSVPRHLILLSKWAGGYLLLLVPFLVAFAGGVSYGWAKGALILKADTIMPLLSLLVIAGLFLSAFFSFGLLISAITHRSTTSLFICLFGWVVWILVIPNLAPVMSRIIAPTVAERKVEAEKRAVTQEISLRKKRVTATSGELGYGDKISKEMEKLDEEKKFRHKEWDRFLEKGEARQNRIAETLGRLSPTGSWIYSATALTGTGKRSYKGVLAGRDRMIQELHDNRNALHEHYRQNRQYPENITSNLPVLKIRYPRFGETLQSVLNDALLLIVLNLAFFMGAFLRFLRYDIR